MSKVLPNLISFSQQWEHYNCSILHISKEDWTKINYSHLLLNYSEQLWREEGQWKWIFLPFLSNPPPFSSEFNLSTIQEGLLQANNVIRALNKTKYTDTEGDTFTPTYETRKLLDIITTSSEFQLKKIQLTFKQLQSLELLGRVKREIVSPLGKSSNKKVSNTLLLC